MAREIMHERGRPVPMSFLTSKLRSSSVSESDKIIWEEEPAYKGMTYVKCAGIGTVQYAQPQ